MLLYILNTVLFSAAVEGSWKPNCTVTTYLEHLLSLYPLQYFISHMTLTRSQVGVRVSTLIELNVCSCTDTSAGAWRCFWTWCCRGRSRLGWWCCWCSRASSLWSTGSLGCKWCRRYWSGPSHCTASMWQQTRWGWPLWCESPFSPWRKCPSSSTLPQHSALWPGKKRGEDAGIYSLSLFISQCYRSLSF